MRLSGQYFVIPSLFTSRDIQHDAEKDSLCRCRGQVNNAFPLKSENTMRKRLRLISVYLFALACAGEPEAAGGPPKGAVPLVVKNGQPGEGHQNLNTLVGEWTVEKSMFMGGGTAQRPIVSRDIVSRWQWIEKTNGRFLREETEGTMGGNPYYRLGTLGYSNMDKRYEWNTVDGVMTMMMAYKGEKNSGPGSTLSMTGEFTDQGVLGEAYVGKTIGMRFVMKLESRDRNVLELYFTPPGESERLVDRAVYTRKKS